MRTVKKRMSSVHAIPMVTSLKKCAPTRMREQAIMQVNTSGGRLSQSRLSCNLELKIGSVRKIIDKAALAA